VSPAPTSLVLAETAVTVAAIYAVWWWFLRRHRTAARHAAKESPANELEPPVVCSFCGKSQDQVRKIIAGPKVYICDECIDLCNDIIAEEYKQEDGSRTAPRSGPPVVLPWLELECWQFSCLSSSRPRGRCGRAAWRGLSLSFFLSAVGVSGVSPPGNECYGSLS